MGIEISTASWKAQQAIEEIAAQVFIRRDEFETVVQGINRLKAIIKKAVIEIEIIDENYMETMQPGKKERHYVLSEGIDKWRESFKGEGKK